MKEENVHTNIALIKQKIGFMSDILVSIEKHLEKQNGRIASHSKKIAYIIGIGSALVFVVPLVIVYALK